MSKMNGLVNNKSVVDALAAGEDPAVSPMHGATAWSSSSKRRQPYLLY